MKRQLGNKVWIPYAKREPVFKQCPDCLGTMRWHCVLPCGEEFDVECPRCYPGGFEASTGVVCEEHTIKGGAVLTTITGVQTWNDKIEFSTEDGSGLTEDELFDTEAEALARSVVKMTEWTKREDEEKVKRARSKGRPRKDQHGNRAANDSEFGGGTANYARRVVRDSLREAFRWIDFAKRKGTEIDLLKIYNAMLAERDKERT